MNNKSRLTLRIIAGLYLLYSAYSLLTNWDPKSKFKIAAILSILIFSVTGIILIIMSVKSLIKTNKDEKEK
ncbi:MAG: hypothetical protein WCQ54_08960 [Clostridiaceae bacterium]